MSSNVPAPGGRKVVEGLFQYAVANAEKLKELWDFVNKDDRANEAVKGLVNNVRQGLAERDPVARLGRQLDAIAEAVEAEADEDEAQAEVRRARVGRIRSRLALAGEMPAAARRQAVLRLTSEVSAFFAEMVEDGLETDPHPADPTWNRKLPWSRKRNQVDY